MRPNRALCVPLQTKTRTRPLADTARNGSCLPHACRALHTIAPAAHDANKTSNTKNGRASPRDIQGFRKIGSSLIGVRKQSFEMETCIHEKFQDFLPAGLQQHLASRDEAGTDDATMKVTKIHKRLFDYVIGALKRYFGTENKAWWTQGIPVKIRQECSSNWEAKDRDGEEESHLYLINYIDICHNNWDLVKDVISLGAADKNNKRQNTKWIRSLNDIRQITMHPERGVLSTDQVTLVNEIFDKVEKHFPDEDE